MAVGGAEGGAYSGEEQNAAAEKRSGNFSARRAGGELAGHARGRHGYAAARYPMTPPEPADARGPAPSHAEWFAAQVQPHEPMLRAWLRARFADEGDLDDVVQETYARLFRARERGGVASPRAFLFTVARNLALDRLRHRQALRLEPLAGNEELSVLEEGEGIPETLARHQELELLTQAIQSLPDRCRRIFTLRKVYGLPQAEIARRLGVSENTISAQLTIGVRKCMEFMARCRREREGRWP
jgi:RNA polymerase sigma-70 factor (ECF subfamily)